VAVWVLRAGGADELALTMPGATVAPNAAVEEDVVAAEPALS
jgi:hypothetical protein